MQSAGSLRATHANDSPSYEPWSHHDDEERKGLLSDRDYPPSQLPEELPTESAPSHISWSPKKIAGTALVLILLVICGVFARAFLFRTEPLAQTSLHWEGKTLQSNGTHDFKRTVLMVSVDGLRADYLDRGLTPHLLDISKQGLRAKYMKPIFPTLTFPNHWTMMTGLYAESHGIVANNFWDPSSKSEFHYDWAESCWNASWWLGQPMWETVEAADIITANLMWPGPPKTMSGVSSTYFVPWRNKVPLAEKLDQIFQWIDLPLELRPQLILAYEPSVDQAGHLTGPMSDLVNKTLRTVDVFARDLHTALKHRNLTDIVDIIFVSDHGMTDTSHPDLIYMDDILGDGFHKIEHEDGWPSMGLRFHPDANSSHYLNVLLDAAHASGGKFEVYTHETMPERYHFANNERIAPIYVVPKLGYVLTNHNEDGVGMSKGTHGYDNHEHSMEAIFIAHGPFSSVSKLIHKTTTSHSPSRALLRPNKGWHSTSDDTYVMNGFKNVEVYNLVIRLLGISGKGAPNNGTTNFWDQYF